MKGNFTLLTLLLFFTSGFAQNGPAITQNIVAGGNSNDRGFGIDSTFDGGVVVAGSTTSSNNSPLITRRVANGNSDALVMRYDINGNLVWSICYGGTNNDILNDIIQTQDGGFIAVGKSNSVDFDLPAGNDATFSNMWIIKLSSAGTIEWSRVYGGTQAEDAVSVIQLSDASFVVAGVTSSAATAGFPASPAFGNRDMVLVKLDPSGNNPSFHRYGATRDDIPSRVIQLMNGNFVVIGTTSSNTGMVTGNHYTSTITNDIWVVWLNSSLGHIENRCYGSTGTDNGVSVEELNDGTLVIAGTVAFLNNGDIRQLPSHGGNEGWIARIDASLPRPSDTIWTRPIGGSDIETMKSMVKTADGNVILAMQAQSPSDAATDITGKISSGNISDVWVAKFNINDASILFRRCYGTSASDDVDKIMLWKSDHILFVGTLQGLTRDFDVSGQPAYGASDLWMASALDIVSTLPIQLVYFRGRVNSGFNKLEWQTDNESNSKEFVVERSADGIAFKTIGTIAAAGESDLPINYEYIDNNPTDIAIYRLRMTDKDGSSKLSRIVRLEQAGKQTGLVAAQLWDSKVVFTVMGKRTETATLQLIDAGGRLIASSKTTIGKGTATYQLPIGALQPGVYIAVVVTGEGKSAISIVK